MNKLLKYIIVGGMVGVMLAVLVLIVSAVEGIYKTTSGTECLQTIRYTNTTNPANAYTGNNCEYNITFQSNFTQAASGNLTELGNGFYQYNCSGLSNGNYLMFAECNYSGDYNYAMIEFVVEQELDTLITNVNNSIMTKLDNTNTSLWAKINNTNTSIMNYLINGSNVNETMVEKAVWYNSNYAHVCNQAP